MRRRRKSKGREGGIIRQRGEERISSMEERHVPRQNYATCREEERDESNKKVHKGRDRQRGGFPFTRDDDKNGTMRRGGSLTPVCVCLVLHVRCVIMKLLRLFKHFTDKKRIDRQAIQVFPSKLERSTTHQHNWTMRGIWAKRKNKNRMCEEVIKGRFVVINW